MVFVSGPVSVYIFEVFNKQVFLFGDIHANKLIPYKKAIPITKFLDELPKTVDLFLESPYISKHSKKTLPDYEPSSVITTLYNHYKNKMYRHHSKSDDFRVHFTDIRQGIDFKFFMNIVDSLIKNLIVNNDSKISIKNIDTLISTFPTMSKISEYVEIVVFSDDFKRDSHKLFPSFNSLDMITKKPNGNIMVHRLRKQILKLDVNLQRSLVKFHKDKCRYILKNTKLYDRVVKNAKEHNLILNQNDALDLLVVLMSWNNHVKDMYTLARMLYYISNGNDIIVSYDGNEHTLMYVEFFEKYMSKNTEMIYNQSVVNKKKNMYLTLP